MIYDAALVKEPWCPPARATLGYVRTSTTRQELSLGAQEDKIRAMAVVKGIALSEVIIETESAKDLDRPGMERLLRMVDAGEVGAVIIAKLDRITRSVKDLATILERFHKAGASLVSVDESLDTGTASGRLVMNIMCAVSQWEREAIGERTRVGLAKLRSQGKMTGKPRYGWRSVGKGLPVEVDPVEMQNLEFIRSRPEGSTLRSIADCLNSRGRTVRSGAAWTVNDVQRLAKGTS
jgi:DNA invertase Pin-like site-specific DNA recombinase